VIRRLRHVAHLLLQARRLGRSPLFDATWYRTRHGPTAWPALHYLRHGAAMGCHPGPAFDGDAYRAANPDVDLLGVNPLWHFLSEGRLQGRAIFPVTESLWSPPAPMPPSTAPADAPCVPPTGTTLSILVPTRDQATLLSSCVSGLLRQATAAHVEILIINHASRTHRARRLLHHLARHPAIRILSFTGPFNWSAMNNLAARHARGDVLLLLNNDTAGPAAGTLDELAALALQPGTGAAGATLLYPNGRIQHAGITLGRRAVATHLFRHAAPTDPAIPRHRRDVAAVTGACLAMRRDLFLAIGGLDETLPVTNSDIDLCIRLRAGGLACVVTPHAVMIHAESTTRRLDTTDADRARLARERQILLDRWGSFAETDPTLP